MMQMNAMTLAVSQDVDLGRVIVVILFLLGGFVQWIIKWWKVKNAGSAPDFNVADKIEELKARSKAWLKQTGQSEAPEQKPLAATPAASVRHTRQPHVRNAVQPPPIPSNQTDRNIKVSSPAGETAPIRRSHPLLDQIAGIGGLKRAIMLNEILGPPKALQNELRQIN